MLEAALGLLLLLVIFASSLFAAPLAVVVVVVRGSPESRRRSRRSGLAGDSRSSVLIRSAAEAEVASPELVPVLVLGVIAGPEARLNVDGIVPALGLRGVGSRSVPTRIPVGSGPAGVPCMAMLLLLLSVCDVSWWPPLARAGPPSRLNMTSPFRSPREAEANARQDTFRSRQHRLPLLVAALGVLGTNQSSSNGSRRSRVQALLVSRHSDARSGRGQPHATGSRRPAPSRGNTNTLYTRDYGTTLQSDERRVDIHCWHTLAVALAEVR